MLAGAVLERGSSLSHAPRFRCSFQSASLSCSGGECNLGSGCQLRLGMYLFGRICFSLGPVVPGLGKPYASDVWKELCDAKVWSVGSWLPGEGVRFLWPPRGVCLLFWMQSGVKQDMLWPGTVTVTYLCSNLCSLGWGLVWPLLLTHDVWTLCYVQVFSSDSALVSFSSVCPRVYQLLPQQALQLLWISDSVGCAQTLHRRNIIFLLEMHKNEWIQIGYSSSVVEAESTLSESSLFTMCLSSPSAVFLHVFRSNKILLHFSGSQSPFGRHFMVFLVQNMSFSWRTIASNRVSLSLTEYGIFPYWASTLQNCISVVLPGNDSVIVQ